MTQEEKLEGLRNWLRENKKLYYEPLKYNDEKNILFQDKGVKFVLPKKFVAVIACKPDEEKEAFAAVRQYNINPVFIREEDSMDFVIEKIQNRLKGWCTAKVRKEEAKKLKAEARAKAKEEAERKAALEAAKKPKRKRIHFVRVENVRRPRL